MAKQDRGRGRGRPWCAAGSMLDARSAPTRGVPWRPAGRRRGSERLERLERLERVEAGVACAAHRRPVLQSRADEDREDVGEQVQQHVDRGDEQAERLHDRHVAVGHGVDQRRADAGEPEEVLDRDDAAGQPCDVDGDHLDGGDDRVGQRVVPQHPGLRDALEARHHDVLALEYLDGRGAQHAADVRDDGQDQGRHRQDEQPHLAGQRGERVDVGDGRQPLEHSRGEERAPGRCRSRTPAAPPGRGCRG